MRDINSSKKLIQAVALVMVVVGCDSAPTPRVPAKGHYSKETLGQIPTVPGQRDADVVSLVQLGGATPEYRVKTKTLLRSGDNMVCELKGNEVVKAIADADSTFLIHAQKTALTKPCENSGEAEFVEGYVSKSDLELVSLPPLAVEQPELKVEAPSSSDSSMSASAKAETMHVSDLKCEKAKYGSSSEDFDKAWNTSKFGISMSMFAGMPGELWRKGGDKFFITVEGKADQWQVRARNKDNKNEMDSKVFKSRELSKLNGAYLIPFKKFVEKPNKWRGASIEIFVKPQTSSGEEGESKCVVKLQLMSPLVFDFSGQSFIETVAASESNINFDLNADGRAEQTGWVKGKSSAFLALDLNRNGHIDNGSELFGDATVIVGQRKKANDGFAALAAYDVNHDGKIDSKDPVFNKLSLWFDLNRNGHTDRGELVSLSQRKVQSISVRPAEIPRNLALQHRDSLVPNDVRTRATFFAAGCPAAGCRVYDIFFGTVESRSVSQKR
jgi:hypothetical protein